MKKKKEKYKNIAGWGFIMFFSIILIDSTLWNTIIMKFFAQAALLIGIVAGVLYLKEPDT